MRIGRSAPGELGATMTCRLVEKGQEVVGFDTRAPTDDTIATLRGLSERGEPVLYGGSAR
ncbi:MAG: hypothetical protein ACRDZ6_05745 [Acidimicrobiales bacterium]